MDEPIVITKPTDPVQVLAIDDPGSGGAHHHYQAVAGETEVGGVMFQDGPVKEVGVNGMHNEHLLLIVAHRLRCFQKGPYACRENGIALERIEDALRWLDRRTAARQRRGVEGTSKA